MCPHSQGGNTLLVVEGTCNVPTLTRREYPPCRCRHKRGPRRASLCELQCTIRYRESRSVVICRDLSGNAVRPPRLEATYRRGRVYDDVSLLAQNSLKLLLLLQLQLQLLLLLLTTNY